LLEEVDCILIGELVRVFWSCIQGDESFDSFVDIFIDIDGAFVRLESGLNPIDVVGEYDRLFPSIISNPLKLLGSLL
jgi:hypothetical protein